MCLLINNIVYKISILFYVDSRVPWEKLETYKKDKKNMLILDKKNPYIRAEIKLSKIKTIYITQL